MKSTYYIATSFLNKDDLFPAVREVCDSIPDMELACDWPRLGVEFLMHKTAGLFDTGDEEIAARQAIARTEIEAVCGCDIFILALPGGTGTFFEYGLAYMRKIVSQTNPHIIIYAASKEFIAEAQGHFIALEGTYTVVGDFRQLRDCILHCKSEDFKRTMN